MTSKGSFPFSVTTVSGKAVTSNTPDESGPVEIHNIIRFCLEKSKGF